MTSFVRMAAWLLVGLFSVQAQDIPTLVLLSRPDIRAPVLTVHNYTSDLVAPGYIFLTPTSPTTMNLSTGPYIYNNDGQLVWSGYRTVEPGMGAFNPQVCQHNSSPHLCFTQFGGPIQGGVGSGSKSVILDTSYTPKVAIQPLGTLANQSITQDLHEFQTVGSGESALITSYVSVPMAMTFANCHLDTAAVKYVKIGLFLELSTDGKNTEIFRWNSLDHVHPSQTFVCPGDMHVGIGDSLYEGFDYFHINSVDKDEDGDYLVSGRHVSAIFKISGLRNRNGYEPGDIIWQMGGRNSSFGAMTSKIDNVPSLNFSYQHHARWQPQLGGISLWNNANNDIQQASANASSGMVIELGGDDANPEATLTALYVSPDRQLDSSAGSHQVLPNGNHLMGMGNYPFIYEYASSGQLAFYASFGTLSVQSYRVFRYEWTANPLPDEMALFSYARNCSAPTTWYVSWNGATEVAEWRFYSSDTHHGAPWNLAGQMMHGNTFETIFQGTEFAPWTYAVAYDKSGNQLAETISVSTFVPNQALASKCNDTACAPGTLYLYSERDPCASGRFR